MAKDDTNESKPKRETKPRPLYILYRQAADGSLEVITVTRDAAVVVETVQADPQGVKLYKHEETIGR